MLIPREKRPACVAFCFEQYELAYMCILAYSVHVVCFCTFKLLYDFRLQYLFSVKLDMAWLIRLQVCDSGKGVNINIWKPDKPILVHLRKTDNSPNKMELSCFCFFFYPLSLYSHFNHIFTLATRLSYTYSAKLLH